MFETETFGPRLVGKLKWEGGMPPSLASQLATPLAGNLLILRSVRIYWCQKSSVHSSFQDFFVSAITLFALRVQRGRNMAFILSFCP